MNWDIDLRYQKFSYLPKGKEEEEEEEKEDEEEEDLSDLATRTGEKCSFDGEAIHFGEETVHITLCQIQVTDGTYAIVPVVDEDGDYAYAPHFLEFTCWETLTGDLRKMLEDAPPVKHAEELLVCHYCASSVCAWETFATGYLGELHVSERQPHGHATPAFVKSSEEPFAMCLGCLLLTNDHTIELWEPEELNQMGECPECTHARCWRWGGCTCTCHQGA